MGFSACFLGAMNLASKGKVPAQVTVETQTSIGKPVGQEGFGLGLKLVVRGEGSGVKQEDLEKFVKAGHEVCPYSRATRGNIDVEFEVIA